MYGKNENCSIEKFETEISVTKMFCYIFFSPSGKSPENTKVAAILSFVKMQ